ncbi:hypothetical protein JCM8097_005720 [Rhodosporidiobolus ruineniae]
MLDRFPPEILDAILVLTYPPSPWPDTSDKDKERRQSLYRLSLVCRAVSAHAQQLLFRTLAVDPSKGPLLTCLQVLDTPYKTSVQVIRMIRRPILPASAISALFPLVRQCSGTKKLQCTYGWITWEELSSLTLDTLEVYSAEIRSEPSVGGLDLQPLRLVRLTLFSVTAFEKASFERVLIPEVLPTLRVLCVSQCGDVGSAHGYFPPIPTQLAQQLDRVQLVHKRFGYLGDENPSVLYALPTAVLTSCKLFSGKARFTTTASSDFNRLLNLVQTTSLTSLFLPISLHELNRTMSLSFDSLDALLKASTAKKVEVVWHDEEGELSFSRAFWAYAKGLNAERRT